MKYRITGYKRVTDRKYQFYQEAVKIHMTQIKEHLDLVLFAIDLCLKISEEKQKINLKDKVWINQIKEDKNLILNIQKDTDILHKELIPLIQKGIDYILVCQEHQNIDIQNRTKPDSITSEEIKLITQLELNKRKLTDYLSLLHKTYA